MRFSRSWFDLCSISPPAASLRCIIISQLLTQLFKLHLRLIIHTVCFKSTHAHSHTLIHSVFNLGNWLGGVKMERRSGEMTPLYFFPLVHNYQVSLLVCVFWIVYLCALQPIGGGSYSCVHIKCWCKVELAGQREAAAIKVPQTRAKTNINTPEDLEKWVFVPFGESKTKQSSLIHHLLSCSVSSASSISLMSTFVSVSHFRVTDSDST